MVDKEFLSERLSRLRECSSTKFYREAVEILLKIYRNIFNNPEDPKFRIIKPENPVISQKLWSSYDCRLFLISSGWIEVHGKLAFTSDEVLLDVIDLLLEHRAVKPSPSKWEESSKHQGKSEAQLHEDELKRKAAIERQKELDEFMKDKKYREELAKNIKAQITSDRLRKRPEFTQPVMGFKLKKGAKIKTLQTGCSSQKD